jgi:methylated-DNA-protein-cysteine methyltransferase-like protein
MKPNQELVSPQFKSIKPNFKTLVVEIVSAIPRGRLMTYGQVAALAGSPRAARIVGGIAHYGNPDLPWQRVVNKQGYLASGYPGGRVGHQQALEKDGVDVRNFKTAIEKLIWWP